MVDGGQEEPMTETPDQHRGADQDPADKKSDRPIGLLIAIAAAGVVVVALAVIIVIFALQSSSPTADVPSATPSAEISGSAEGTADPASDATTPDPDATTPVPSQSADDAGESSVEPNDEPLEQPTETTASIKIWDEGTSRMGVTYPIDVTLERPVLLGVSDDIVTAFDKEFQDQFDAQLTDFENYLNEVQPTPDKCASAEVDGDWTVSEMEVKAKPTAIYDNYATATITYDYSAPCGKDILAAHSVTISLKNGKSAAIENFYDSKTQQKAADSAISKACKASKSIRADMLKNIEAFSPTQKGVVMTWGNSYVAACGLVQITLAYK
jgi:hypothetical protein